MVMDIGEGRRRTLARRDVAIRELRALGATFAESGSVADLSAAIRRGHRRPQYSARSQCLPKKRHNSFAAASREARRMSKVKGVGCEAYSCPHCRAWHVGQARKG